MTQLILTLCGIQILLFIWSSKNSSDLPGMHFESPHISHVLNWLSLSVLSACFAFVGIRKTGNYGPGLLQIWTLWCLVNSYKSLKAFFNNESRDT